MAGHINGRPGAAGGGPVAMGFHFKSLKKAKRAFRVWHFFYFRATSRTWSYIASMVGVGGRPARFFFFFNAGGGWGRLGGGWVHA